MRRSLTMLSPHHLLTSVLSLALVAFLPSNASAQSSYYYWWSDAPSRPAYRSYKKRQSAESQIRLSSDRRRAKAGTDSRADARDTEPAKEKPKVVAAPASATTPALQSQLLTVISIGSQKVTVYDATGEIDHGPVSTGQAGHRTPTGIFSIIQKNRFHRSNIYSGAPMPYMQRITWSGIAMHQGVLPGYPASHGCIRLPQSFASTHFGRTKLGMRVVVSPEPTAAVAFSHAKLPEPLFTSIESKVTDASPSALPAEPIKVASAEGREGEQIGLGILSPMERAAAARVRAVAEVSATADAARAALDLAAAKSAAAGEAIERLRRSEADLAEAQAELAMVSRALEQATNPEALEHIKVTKVASEARVTETTMAMSEARANEEMKRNEAFAAAAAAREAEKAADLAAETAKGARRWTEPVSVFISKKEGRVFVRQGFAPIHEAPVEFKDKDAPIGTHLFVAMDSPDGGRSLKWKAVTVPNSGVAPAHAGNRKKGEEPPAPARPRESAAGALERVVLPENVRTLIAERLWPGASIIISDYGISNEQGEGATTDFIVLTR